MKAIIDSSPLISMSVINQLELLEKLLPKVIVPPSVLQEIARGGDKVESLEILDFIQNRIYYPKNEIALGLNLGKGETEAIALCLELAADLLIVDDKKARNAAESCNIKCIGTLGLLTLAKKRGFIKELRHYFIQLVEKERYFALELLNDILALNEERSIPR